MDISVVIRTFNEARYLDELLSAIANQATPGKSVEVVVVDSGSTDDTRTIANQHGCRVESIRKEDFTFGRSLNVGCQAASGDYLVFISGHCVPTGPQWLSALTEPLAEGSAEYVYGRQIGRDTTKFSERQVFAKYFPAESRIPQRGEFANNANSALRRDVWQQYPFDETITGLEDIHLAKRIQAEGLRIGYQADAQVYHIHDESWPQVKWRYEREALALREISPEIHMSALDFVRCVWESVLHDSAAAMRGSRLLRELRAIIFFRVCQYWGSYRGSHENRQLSNKRKRQFFYPKEAVEPPHPQRHQDQDDGRSTTATKSA